MKSAKRNAWDKIKVVVAFALFASLFTAFAFEEWRISQHIPKPTGEIAKSSQVGYLQKYSTYCAAKPAHENDKWQHDFWCDFKFTDFIMAAFTVALVFVTGGLIVVGIFQNRQLSRQIKLAREEFISTHRPRLIVRQFQVDPVVAGQPITVHLAMINIGDTDALPNLIACEVALWNDPAQHFEPPGIDKVQKTINVPPIKGGQRAQFSFQSRFNVTQQQLNDILGSTLLIEVVGEFTYRDPLKTQRRTGFRRAYDRKADKFIPSPNVDEEYCD